MEASDFYEKKPVSFRNLEDGAGIKNAHNFVKAVLIKRFVPSKHVHVNVLHKKQISKYLTS